MTGQRRAATTVVMAVLLLTSSSSCGRYGPPLRGPAPEKPEQAQTVEAAPEAEANPEKTKRKSTP